MNDRRASLQGSPNLDKGSQWATDANFRVDEHKAEWRRLGGIPAPCAVCDQDTSSLVFRPDGSIGRLVVLHGLVLCEGCIAKATAMRRVIVAPDSVGEEFLIVTGLCPADLSELN